MAAAPSSATGNQAPQPEYIIESSANVPLLVRIRDFFLILIAWVAWGFVIWQVLGQHIDTTGISDVLLARLKIAVGLAWAGIKFAGLLLLVIAPFSIYSFFSSRAQERVPEPVPLGTGEISDHTRLSSESVADWQSATNLSIAIGDEGAIESFNTKGQAIVPLPQRPHLNE